MKKKIIILIGLLFLLCGCTSEATLTVNRNNINEEITTTYYADSYMNKNNIKLAFRDYFPVFKEDELYDEAPDVKLDGVSYYNKTLTELDNGYIGKYQYNYSFKSYKKSNSLSTAFTSYNIMEDSKNGTLTISTAKNSFKLFNIYSDLDLFKIKIKSDLQVVEANVEPVDGVYIWTFTPDSHSDNIYIVFNTKVNNDGTSSNPTSNNNGVETVKDDTISTPVAILYALGGVAIFFLGLLIINKMEKKR